MPGFIKISLEVEVSNFFTIVKVKNCLIQIYLKCKSKSNVFFKNAIKH